VVGDLVDAVVRDIGDEDAVRSRRIDVDRVDADPISSDNVAVFQAVDHLSRHWDIAVEHGVGLARALRDLIRIGDISLEAQFVARGTQQVALDLEMLKEVIGNNDQTQDHGLLTRGRAERDRYTSQLFHGAENHQSVFPRLSLWTPQAPQGVCIL
jgi:hypothetical protein